MCIFAVEFSGETVQAAAQSILVDLHQLLAFSVQLHTNTKLALPVYEKDELSATNNIYATAKSILMRHLISSITALCWSMVASEEQLASFSSWASGISASLSMFWPSSGSLLTSDMSPFGTDLSS